MGGPGGIRTRSRLLAREPLLPIAAGPCVAGAGVEPACGAYEAPLIPDPPHGGDRPDSCAVGRNPTGFLRGHVPASRPLQPRSQLVGRRGVEPRRPAVSARRLHRLAHALCGGPGSARISSCRLSTGCSTVRASGPRTAQSRRRESNPLRLGYGPSVRPFGPRRRGCQRRTRTSTVGVTVRRPAVRRSGIEYRGGESNPGLRVEGPASCPLDYRGMEEAVGLAPTGTSRPLPAFGTGSSSGRIASVASPARFERATPAFGGRCSRPSELRRAGVDGTIRTCTLRFRRPVPCPFGHVDVAPPMGLEPMTVCSTGSCSSRLSYGGTVRALGLEPSLVRGKSPVPYLSGVARVVVGGPDDDASAVVKVRHPGWLRRWWSRLGRCRTPGRRFWRQRRHPWLEPKGMDMAGNVLRRRESAAPSE